MFNIIKMIREYQLKKEKECIRKIEEGLLVRSCEKLSIPIDDLIPVSDEECEQIISQLELKVAKEIGEEPYTISGADCPGSGIPENYVLPRAFTWRDYIRSLKERTKPVYKVRSESQKGMLLLFYFSSSKETWRQLCGRAGYMLLSTDPLKELGFVRHRMN